MIWLPIAPKEGAELDAPQKDARIVTKRPTPDGQHVLRMCI